jgi:hypothetical protein
MSADMPGEEAFSPGTPPRIVPAGSSPVAVALLALTIRDVWVGDGPFVTAALRTSGKAVTFRW